MKTVAVAALATGLFASADALAFAKRDNPKVVGIPVYRRDTTKLVASPALRRRQQTVGQTLDNFEGGSLYFANSTIGTPAQNFRFHVDTGSSDLWANVATSQICAGGASVGGGSGNGQIPCDVSGVYSANKSSSYKYVNSDFTIKYADGTGASGDYVTDTFSMGGATIQNQQFGVGYKSTSGEGVMGIGYPALEAFVQNTNDFNPPQPYSNIPQSMVTQKLINTPSYSLWLDDINSLTGSILFGGVDTAKYSGSLVTLPIQKEEGQNIEMVIQLDGVSVNTNGQNQTALSSPTNVLLDSGSTLSFLPTQAAKTVFQAVGAQYSSSDQLAFCSCDLANSSDTMSFSFAGGQKVITVNMADMVLTGGVSQSLDCTFGISEQPDTGASNGGSFTLGDTFIRNAYVVYDLANNEISLAQTNRDATTSNVMEIQSGSSGVPDVTGSAAPPSATAGGAGGSSSSKGAAVPTSAPNLAAAVVAGAGLVLAAL